MTDIVDQLNRLLTAERAGVEALCGLVAQAPTSEIRSLFGQMRDDEAWTCTGLVDVSPGSPTGRCGPRETSPEMCWRYPRSRIGSAS